MAINRFHVEGKNMTLITSIVSFLKTKLQGIHTISLSRHISIFLHKSFVHRVNKRSTPRRKSEYTRDKLEIPKNKPKIRLIIFFCGPDSRVLIGYCPVQFFTIRTAQVSITVLNRFCSQMKLKDNLQLRTLGRSF